MHPGVVYLSISGFGHRVPEGTPDSPYAGWPALAAIVEAMSGAYEFKRPPGRAPVGAPMGGLGDIVTALFAVIGTQAALRQRDRTGRAQRVDVAMLDAMVAVLDVVPNFWSMGMPMGTPWPGILHGFREHDYDILVGTQMIAKGHDIPNVTLVGVVSADIGLGLPDFRSAERTFQLLTQAAGRAGRGDLPGIVLIQTINPEHYAIRFASQQNYAGFYAKEIQFRKLMRYPPFSALANVLVRSQKQDQALAMSSELGRVLDPAPEGVKVLGPAEAPVPKLKSEFRYQLLLKAANRKRLNEVLRDVQKFAVEKKWGATALVIDVDPLTLL